MKVVPALAVVALSMPAMADYKSSFEASFGVSDYKESFQGGSFKSEDQFYSISGAYFFNGVNTKSVPLYEAAFLSKSSIIGAAFSRVESTISTQTDDDQYNYTYDVSSKSLLGFGVVNNFVIGGSVTSYDYDDYLDTREITLELGYYLTDTSNIAVSVTREEYDGIGEGDTDHYYGIMYHGVYHNQWALTLQYDDMDEANAYAIGGSHFFTQKMGLSAGFNRNSSEDGDSQNAYGLEFHYFINEMHGLFAGVSRIDDDDYDTFSIRYRLNI